MGRTSRKRRRKKKLNVTEIAENEEESLTHLKSWLSRNNCLSISNLVPSYFSVTGRGLKTLENIKVDDVLIRLPYKILITTSTISQSYIKHIFSKNERYSAQCILSIFLVYESHLGNTSRWCHYVNSLPQTLTNPDFCMQKEKNLLPAFIADYMYDSHKVQNDFRGLIGFMNSAGLNGRANCPHCSVHFQKIITFERYKWAYYIVNTRAVYIDTDQIETSRDIPNIKRPNNLALAPYLDLFNHDVRSATRASVITDEKDDKFYELSTLKSFDKGSQVFINYGAHNSLKLYVHYGFFVPNNPLDEVYFDISDIEACLAIPKFKLNFIVLNKLQRNMAFTREGLNYNAKSVLFVSSTKLQKEHWSAKIYGDSFTAEDISDTCNIAKNVLDLKRNELMNNLQNMRSLKQYTQCFSIAISLVEEYITILTESYNNLCTFQ